MSHCRFGFRAFYPGVLDKYFDDFANRPGPVFVERVAGHSDPGVRQFQFPCDALKSTSNSLRFGTGRDKLFSLSWHASVLFTACDTSGQRKKFLGHDVTEHVSDWLSRNIGGRLTENPLPDVGRRWKGP